ncbi:nucleotidyl transferase AbiEii/AbiGii toxin family protein [Virgibacillus oceani]
MLQYINKDSDQFVLKGGTGLLVGYGLDRFSKDVVLDARSKKNALSVLENFLP